MNVSSTELPQVTLHQLAALAQARLVPETADDCVITGVDLNSKTVGQQELFAAMPGTKVHGATFAHTAQAAAILTDEAGWSILEQAGETRPVLVVENVREVLGTLAATVYGNPSQAMTVIGITGTSGKTTTSYLLEAGLTAAGCTVGLIGTTGTRIAGRSVPTSLTTPEAPTLQALFAQMRDAGVSHVVMEVSSHALSLGRVQGVDFDVAGFTNLSQDHLDFHATLEEYFAAKALLFEPNSPLAAARSVICIDDRWGREMLERAGAQAKSMATRGELANYVVTDVAVDPSGGQNFIFSGQKVHLPLPGRFNIANAALALALGDAVGVDIHQMITGLANVGVPGRMESIAMGQEFLAVVDYAHKPAAVAAVLETVRAQTKNRVAIVLGCGGDRDRSKRPIMGEYAARGADLVIITDDNPRSEDPATIRQAMLEGIAAIETDAEVLEIGDRRQAIRAAVAWAKPQDSIIIAGKGHEVGQLIQGVNHHFDDRDELRDALQLLLAGKLEQA